MKTPPPFLVGSALVFWGWQSGSGLLVAGILMAVIFESARFTRTKWDFTDEDFSRIWTFCTLLFLGAAVYAFTSNNGPSAFGDFFDNPRLMTQTRASRAGSRTASAVLRWLPMLLFLFVAAQAHSSRDRIPLTSISFLLRRRWLKSRRFGQPAPYMTGVSVGYSFFALCLFAASIHSSENTSYFWGVIALLIWALWPLRSRRFGVAVWAGALAATLALGFLGQQSLARLQGYLQNIDAHLLAAFMRRNTDPTQSRTAFGSIGRVKTSNKIVIRVTPREGNVPDYLRETTHRNFSSPAWHSRSRAGRDDFEGVNSETNETSWILLPGSTNAPSRVGIACYLEARSRLSGQPEGLLPLPTDTVLLENLPAFLLRRNSAGTILAEGPGLVIFDAVFGQGKAADAPPDPAEDLQISEKEQAALDHIVEELQLRGKDQREVMSLLRAFFQNQCRYTTWQDQPPPARREQTPLTRFLLDTRSGHCEHFATATVLLMRNLGFPARYAVGYYVHENSGGGYVVRMRDAHAWCLLWSPEANRWENFDTTPATWIAAESRTSAWGWLSDTWSWIRFQLSRVRWGQTNLRDYILIGLLPVLAFLLFQIVRRRRRAKSPGGKVKEERMVWPGLDSEFYAVERALAARGIARRPHEPLSEWLQRALNDPDLTKTNLPIRELLRLHYQYRFDPQGLSDVAREELRQDAKECIARLAHAR